MAKYPRKDRKPIREPSYDIEQIVSTTDCTGIAPTPPQDASEAESYAHMAGIHTPKVDNPSDD